MPAMPILPLSTMTKGMDKSDVATIAACLNARTGQLLSKKPYKDIDFSDPKLPSPLFKATVNLAWRMLCFDFCDFGPHNCMPCTADWDVRTWYYRTYGKDHHPVHRRQTVDAIGDLVRRAEATLSVTLQKGALRWGQAYGLM